MKHLTPASDLTDTLIIGGVPAAPALEEATPAVPRHRSLIGCWFDLTKPRMNFLVVLTTLFGYAMVAPSISQNWPLLLFTLLGTALTAAGASVLNQLVEREHDRLMHRTRSRPLPAGRISPLAAQAVGVLLSVAGLAVLALMVNGLTALLGAITLGSYVLLYTPLKRITTLCTIVGAVPGAIPPMMGVTAFENALTPAAWVLFGILFMWQMPHFLAIAILYREDYARGGFKMLPVVDEQQLATARQILIYSLALIPVTLMPTILRMAGPAYFLAAALMGLSFLGFAVLCAFTRTRAHARQLFFASIIYLPCLLGTMVIDKM